jgi:glutamate--cysteine ligase
LYSRYEQRLARLVGSGQQTLLAGGLVGLEKESLRVAPDGSIAQTPHPVALGAALTHPWITTDYSEALLEFITPPFADALESLRFLRDTQRFVYPRLGEEFIWATSMPCVLSGEASIPVARYGTSNPGLMKTVYRRGLGHRYGRMMQVISGVHFNYSVPEAFWPVYQALEQDDRAAQDFISTSYFGMIRNLQRYGWLIPYLFGASPAVCRSFVGDMHTSLLEFGTHTLYEPFATSLRMGDIGYQNSREDKVGVKANYDSLETYVDSLTRAIETPCPEYAKLGVVVDSEYEQLNANLLQIENEYYSTIRPKQILEPLEKPSLALQRRGVKYVELRSLDVNAFDPLGINEEQLRFLETFLLFCLLQDSPPISAAERGEIDQNQSAAAHRGRDPGLRLQRLGKSAPLRDWAQELLSAMEGVSEALEAGHPERGYGASLARQQDTARDPDRTPSARMLREMREGGESFHAFAKRMSLKHQHYFKALPEDPALTARFEAQARQSLEAQRELESRPQPPFAEFLADYFAQR